MHIIDLVRTYEHTFPVVIWCVMRILIFYLVCYKKSLIYLVSASQLNFFLVCYLNRKKISCVYILYKNNASPETIFGF